MAREKGYNLHIEINSKHYYFIGYLDDSYHSRLLWYPINDSLVKEKRKAWYSSYVELDVSKLKYAQSVEKTIRYELMTIEEVLEIAPYINPEILSNLPESLPCDDSALVERTLKEAGFHEYDYEWQPLYPYESIRESTHTYTDIEGEWHHVTIPDGNPLIEPSFSWVSQFPWGVENLSELRWAFPCSFVSTGRYRDDLKDRLNSIPGVQRVYVWGDDGRHHRNFIDVELKNAVVKSLGFDIPHLDPAPNLQSLVDKITKWENDMIAKISDAINRKLDLSIVKTQYKLTDDEMDDVCRRWLESRA